MRLDCPKCGAKGDSRLTKTPRWRCSPSPSNSGCGYEWDDPNYDDPTIDYRNQNKANLDYWARQERREKERLASLSETPEPTPNANSESLSDKVSTFVTFILVVSALAFIVWGCATYGFPGTGGGDGYKETCVIEDRGGRIRETCW